MSSTISRLGAERRKKMTKIPVWAFKKAAELANNECSGLYNTFVFTASSTGASTIGTAFAKYIAEHEEPPVDPDLIKAREIVANSYRMSTISRRLILEGEWDTYVTVRTVLRAIKETKEECRCQS